MPGTFYQIMEDLTTTMNQIKLGGKFNRLLDRHDLVQIAMLNNKRGCLPLDIRFRVGSLNNLCEFGVFISQQLVFG